MRPSVGSMAVSTHYHSYNRGTPCDLGRLVLLELFAGLHGEGPGAYGVYSLRYPVHNSTSDIRLYVLYLAYGELDMMCLARCMCEYIRPHSGRVATGSLSCGGHSAITGACVHSLPHKSGNEHCKFRTTFWDSGKRGASGACGGRPWRTGGPSGSGGSPQERSYQQQQEAETPGPIANAMSLDRLWCADVLVMPARASAELDNQWRNMVREVRQEGGDHGDAAGSHDGSPRETAAVEVAAATAASYGASVAAAAAAVAGTEQGNAKAGAGLPVGLTLLPLRPTSYTWRSCF